MHDDSNNSLLSAYYSLCSFAQFGELKVSTNVIKVQYNSDQHEEHQITIV